ncbi:hypothetical protein [Hymenobacter cavernae]|uniref:Uncharacterized protein n=1 Tax=Hymenobacter cavernae TaxID=2044852 RepID=A0ABQ1UGS4_9BACT|nr:hypothetical protein [Hymenobacter cavernae]GGF17676.1 hypothetical protein GCM10011383_31360 [Hymenobacter cavernae]
MNDKYSQAKREHYGRLLAAHLCQQYFAAPAMPPTATLDGPAILRFTPIRQVNLFVVQQLLAQWTAEMARLRSPYFDFEAPDVRVALTQFMNVLSRRIKLTRTAFEPLLAQAVTDTFNVVMDPTATFDQKLLNAQPTATVEQLRDALRYLDVEKALYLGFLDTLTPGTPLERRFLLTGFQQYQEENPLNEEALANLIGEFNALLPLTEADLREDAPVAQTLDSKNLGTPKLADALKPEPQPVVAPTPPATPTFKPVAAPVATAVAEPRSPSVSQPEAPRRPLVEAAPATAVPLYEKLKAERPTGASLSETLRPERPSGATLAEKAPKVESLREAISINQRFSFINELFNGENMEYHAAIQHLDGLPNADVARRYVTEDLAQKYGWVRKEEHVNKLLKLIERKFA